MSTAHGPADAPRVSVVIPAHNTEPFVVAAIASALNSGISAVEVLVIDDGSTDGTAAAVRALDDPRVHLTSIPASGGPSRPRNVGIQQARAPYVSLLDSDDLLKPDKLAESVAALERHPGAGFAFGDYEKMDEDGNVFECSFAYAYPVFRGIRSVPAGGSWRLIAQPELARALLHENFVGTSGVVVRRELALAAGGFDESIRFGEDVDFWFRLAHRCDALYSSTVGHSYRVRLSGLVRSGPAIGNATARITVLKNERARWRERAAHRILDRRIALNLDNIGYQRLLERERGAALRTWLEALLLAPAPHRLVNLARLALPLDRRGPLER